MLSNSFLGKIGNTATTEAINIFGNAAFGSRLWSDVVMFVRDADGKTGLTGKQKKEKVLADLKTVFENDLAPALGELFLGVLETAVQLGWLYVKSRI